MIELPGRLQHSSIAEAIVALESDYDMVKYSNAHHLSDFLKPPGYFDVFLAGRGITAGVVVNEYDRGG